MGSQTRFYTLPEDEKFLINYILSINNLQLIKEKCNKMEPEIISNISDLFINRKEQSDLLIWVSSDPIPSYAYRTISNKSSSKVQSTNINQNNFYICTIVAPCIEYWRSIVNNKNELTQGRIWAEKSYWHNDILIKKSDDFVNAYKILYNWIRRNFVNNKEVNGYMGQEAIKWYQAGKPIYPPPLKIEK